MKTCEYELYCRPTIQLRYPNATTRRQVLRKLLDGILLAASGAGAAAIILLMALF